MNRLPLFFLIVCVSLQGLPLVPLAAQVVPGLLKPGTQTPAPASADPLGRDTPSGTVLGFLQAAQDGNEKIAADYLQMSAARRQSLGPDTAAKLKVLMDRAFVGSIRRISTRPDGSLESGTSDQQTAGMFSTRDAEIPVILVRVNDPTAGKIWLFSAETLSKVPEVYNNVEEFGDFAERLRGKEPDFPRRRSAKSRNSMTTSKLTR